MNQTHPSLRTRYADEFRSLSLAYAECVHREGVEVVPFVDPSLPLFSALSIALQETALKSIRADIEIFQSISREGFSLRDTSHHLWRYIRSIKAIPDSELFDKIGSSDLVEMYTMNGERYAQIFRNLRVLECVSFTLEQMFGMDWRFGVRRTPEDEALMNNYGQGLLNGTYPTTIALSHPAQIIDEVDSVKRYRFSLRIKYISPVRMNGQVFGLICVGECETLGSAIGLTPGFA